MTVPANLHFKYLVRKIVSSSMFQPSQLGTFSQVLNETQLLTAPPSQRLEGGGSEAVVSLSAGGR